MGMPNETDQYRQVTSVLWLDCVCVLLSWAIGITLFVILDRTCYPIGCDSIRYFEAAENFMAGKGLMHSPGSPEPFEQSLVPLRLWPPGLSLLIATVSSLGFDTYYTAVWIPRISWLLAIPVSVYIFRALGLRLAAGPLALLAMLSFGVFVPSAKVLSDTPYLLFTLLCFLLFYRALKQDSAWFFATGSGLCAAVAYSIRNVGMSLLIAIPLTLIILLAIRATSRGQSMRLLALWLGGALPIVAALKLRSLMVFGMLEPYSMEPSTVGVVPNVRWMVFGILHDITGLKNLSLEITWNRWAFAVTAIAGVGALLALFGGWLHEQAKTYATDRIALGIATGLYCAGGMAIVIVARSRYEWGELINSRHAGQYNLLLLAMCAAGLEAKMWNRRTILVLSLSAMCVPLLLCRIFGIADLVKQEVTPGLVIARDQEVISAIRLLPENAMILSNDGPLLTSVSGRDVRTITPVEVKGVVNPYEEQLQEVTSALSNRRPIFAGFVSMTTDPKDSECVVPRGYRVILQKPCFSLLVFDGDCE